MVMQKMNNMLF